jgi:endoglucanase
MSGINRFGIKRFCFVLCAFCLLIGNSCKNLPSASELHKTYALPTKGDISPLSPFELWYDPRSTPENWWSENRLELPDQAEKIKTVIGVPTAFWIREETPVVRENIKNAVQLASEDKQLPVFCIYNIVGRDINLYSKGGSKDAKDYIAFIERLDSLFGTSPMVIILEPDALSQATELSETAQKERFTLLKNAVQILSKNPKRFIYLDGGNSAWHSPEEQAKLLRQAGIEQVRGFCVNVSNFQTLEDSVRYSQDLSKLTNGKSAIIDTSRSGLGPSPDKEWCNPSGRALGVLPTTHVHAPIDALLWVKHPWESDGDRAGAPPAGDVYMDYLFDLIQNTQKTNREVRSHDNHDTVAQQNTL